MQLQQFMSAENLALVYPQDYRSSPPIQNDSETAKIFQLCTTRDKT